MSSSRIKKSPFNAPLHLVHHDVESLARAGCQYVVVLKRILNHHLKGTAQSRGPDMVKSAWNRVQNVQEDSTLNEQKPKVALHSTVSMFLATETPMVLNKYH